MGWSYTPGSGLPLDTIRELIGDVNPGLNNPAASGNPGQLQLDDAVINNFILTEIDQTAAAYECAKSLLAKIAFVADTGLKSAGLAANQRYERLKAVRDDLEFQCYRAAVISSPATNRQYVSSSKLDPTRLRPLAWIGMLDADLALAGLPDDGPWSLFYESW